MRQEFETTSSRQLVTVFEFMIRKSFEKQYHYIGTELSRQLLYHKVALSYVLIKLRFSYLLLISVLVVTTGT